MRREDDFLKLSEVITKTANATSEFLGITGFDEIDSIFGAILGELNDFFKKIENHFKDFVIFERYIICAYTREQGYSLKEIPSDVRNRVWELRENTEICGFTGEECKCKKSIEYLKQRFSDKVKQFVSSGEFLKESSKNLKDGIEMIGEDVSKLTGSAKKIMEIAEIIEIVALNAYIEAARLGENGRGFKVIADEVRRASVRTNELASEIIESIQDLNGKFLQQIEKQTKFDNDIRELEKDQSKFREDLNEDLIWMAQNFMDFLEYIRKAMSSEMDLLRKVRENVLSVLQEIDLTNQRSKNACRALAILSEMIEIFENLLKDKVSLESAVSRMNSLYEEFTKIPKLIEERHVIARVQNQEIDTSKEVVGNKVEEYETDVELF